MNELTAAHRTLPLPTMVRVTNLENGRSIVLRVNDRGPFVHGRIIDVSRRAAQLLGFQQSGTAPVRVRVIDAVGRSIVAKPVTPEAERTAVAAAPREPVAVEALAPPEGVASSPPAKVAPLPHGTVSLGPAPRPAPKADGVVTVVPVEPTRLYVQAGSFNFYDNARRLSAKLSRIGPARITDVVLEGRHFYRVRIGPLESVETADVTLDQVIRSGYPGARIVVD